MLVAGILSALGLLIVLFKLGGRRVLHYDVPIDIGITALLMYLFAGTYSGMFAAIVGGLIVSITLYVAKNTINHEKLSVVRVSKFPYRSVRWLQS